MANRIFPKPLTSQEEGVVLGQLMRGSDTEQACAKEVLVERNVRLVSYLANRYKGVRYELDDLISIGSIGLIKAVNTFSLDKNVKFATYAARCIQNEILMHLRQTKKNQQEVFLEEALRQDSEGNPLSILDILGSAKDDIEREIQDQDTFHLIKELLNELPSDEKELLCHRFGIGTPQKKQKDIAELLNISQSYVSRIEKKALRKIKFLYEKREQTLVG